MSKSIHLPSRFPDLALLSYQKIFYSYSGSVPGVSSEELKYAVSQAFAIWSKVVPVEFHKKTTVGSAPVHITFRPNGSGAPIGNGLIEINTSEQLFTDRFRYQDPPGWGPFDLIGAIAHEIGHNVFGSVITDPWEDNEESGSMMNGGQGEGQVKRYINEGDVAYAQKKLGKLPAVTKISLANTSFEVIDQQGEVNVTIDASGITIAGSPKSSCLIQFYSTDFKTKKINAINFDAVTQSGYSIVNKAEVWDALLPQEWQWLSYSSYQQEPSSKKLQVALSNKHVFKYGLLFRLEILFLEKYQADSSAKSSWGHQVIISSVEAEVLPPGRPDEIFLG